MDPFESLKTFVCEDDTDHTPHSWPVYGPGTPRYNKPWSDSEREWHLENNPFFDKENQIEAGKKGGRITRDNNLGIFNPEYDRTPAAKLGGSKGSRAQIDNNIGIWGMIPEQQSERSKRGAKTTSSQRWKCLVTGHISSPGGLSNHQKGLGIDYKDKSLRVRITHL
jgi:hypothetical protein